MGRMRRLHYGLHFLLNFFLLCVLVGFIESMIERSQSETAISLVFISLVLLLIGYIGITIYAFIITIKRFHDMDKSGWWSLLTLLPFVGFIVMFIITFIPGTKGENRFGPDPKAIKSNNQ